MTQNPAAPPPDAVTLDKVTFLHLAARGVDGVSLSLPQGAIFGLLGPNGSGKSTILSLIAGFLDPQSGTVRVLGETVSATLRRRLGVLFQESSLDPLMTVRETLWLHGRLFGIGARQLKSRIAELLDLVGLDDRSGDDVETLSGGMKRRLELARAVLHRPDLLLLDEPTLGLDPDSKARLWAMLQRINDGGAALLVATNDVAEAERHCHTVAFLEAGRVVTQGTPAALKQGLRRESVRVDWPSPPDDIATTIAAWSGVGQVTSLPPTLHVTVDDASAFVPQLFAAAGGAIQAIQIRESTLEDAYFQWVGRPFQDNGRDGPSALVLPQSDPDRRSTLQP